MRSVSYVLIIEMLRLKSLGLSLRRIAETAGCAKSTVGDVLTRCNACGMDYCSAKALSSEAIQEILYPLHNADKTARKQEPEWKDVEKRLQENKFLNLQFLWEEYIQQTPDGLGYSQYCKKYRLYRQKSGHFTKLHEERTPGSVMQVDWIGKTLDCVVDSKTGLKQTAHFFVSVLGVSGFPYAEAFPDEKQHNWIRGNVNALHYYNGLPRIIRPDNTRTAVQTPRYYEPVINTVYWELGQHYNIAIIPARSRKATDKALVEGANRWLETWLLGILYNQRFFSFPELNMAILERMEELVRRPFQKKTESRLSVFENVDKPALRPIPERFVITDVVTKRVGDNLHVEYDHFQYSVPYQLHKEQVVLRVTSMTVEILDANHQRVASHQRRFHGKTYVTKREHLPPSQRAVYDFRQFDGPRYRSWARSIGDNTFFVIDSILTATGVEEQGYRSCMGILQMGKKNGAQRLETVCRKARESGTYTYAAVNKLMKECLKQETTLSAPIPVHENIRGSEYYQ